LKTTDLRGLRYSIVISAA